MKIIDLAKGKESNDPVLVPSGELFFPGGKELLSTGDTFLPSGHTFVATVGFFDGVHVGHRHLIEQVKGEAWRRGLSSAVVTFPVHPREVLQSDYRPLLLNEREEKLSLLASTGVDCCVILPFTEALSQLTAEEFMRRVLKETLRVDTLFVGYDHRFGRDRAEGYEAYVHHGEVMGMKVLLASRYQVDGFSSVSSSRVRSLLQSGNVQDANRLLSYRYTLSGTIVPGNRVGRTIGFPTANIQLCEPNKVIPAKGVYAVRVRLKDNEVYPGMLYIGTRPTFNRESTVSVEVNLFNFDGDLYGQSLSVEFIDFVRGEVKFNSKEELVARLHRDKEEVMKILGDCTSLSSF